MIEKYSLRSLLTAVSIVFVVAGASVAAEDSQLENEAAIRQLTICYALGTDALGAGDVDKGKALYRDCFTEDAPIAAFFPRWAGG